MEFDFRPIMLVVGLLLATLGGAMLITALVDIIASNEDWQIFTFCGLLCVLLGGGSYAATRGSVHALGTRQAFVMTVGAWVILSFFGSLPYVFSGAVANFTDAYFESVSALTTTGSTVMSDLELKAPGILFWRGFQQWLGGLGIIVMAVAVLPMLQVGGMQLFRIEAFDTAGKILPRATQISGALIGVLAIFTAICAFAYLAAGMSLIDAVIHAMTTVSTGGFSTKDASIGYFDSAAINYICVLFMILGSIPFLLFVQTIRGRPLAVWRDSQVQTFFLVLASAVFIGWFLARQQADNEDAFGLALFNVTSTMTGTGFANADFAAWGASSRMFFLIIMFIGGCAGSTSCGIKIFRMQVLFITVKRHIQRIFYPHGLFTLRYNGHPMREDIPMAVMSFLFLYITIFFIVAVLLSLTGLEFLTALSASATAISNVGPGVSEIIGPAGNFQSLGPVAKWIIIAAMLIGRLEIMTFLVLFTPNFWRN